MPAYPAVPASIQTPAVLVDIDILRRNIAALADAVAARGQVLRPHAKTHKIPEIAAMQLDAGALGLTVATVGEAEVFADAGVGDIFIAFPLWATEPMAERLRDLAARIRLQVGIDSAGGARNLAAHLGPDAAAIPVLVEVDSGHHRSGAVPSAVRDVAIAAREAGLEVAGAFTFPGHSYAPGADAGAAGDENRVLAAAADELHSAGFDVRVLSGGSTPTAFVAGAGAATEVRPGVYVFNDAQQLEMGHCSFADIVLTVAATVISRGRDDAGNERVVLNAGSKVLGSDRPAWISGFARLLEYPEARVTALSEHHGTVLFPPGAEAPVLGSVVRVVPNHVCLVPNLVDEVTVISSTAEDGSALVECRVVDRWAVAARGRNG